MRDIHSRCHSGMPIFAGMSVPLSKRLTLARAFVLALGAAEHASAHPKKHRVEHSICLQSPRSTLSLTSFQNLLFAIYVFGIDHWLACGRVNA
jgi:hypothetical protein